MRWPPARPRVKCYLVQDRSSHEGSGGGFSVVRFFHLVVENRTSVLLRSVKAPYRLMKGKECFQEDALCVEQVAPGATARSETFIRDSAVFDRLEWVGDLVVEADEEIPQGWITFNNIISRPFNPGCLFSLLFAIAVGVVVYYFAAHS